MEIRGLQKMSLLDYPEKIAAIIFTPGCTFRCPFCYNPDLVNNAVQLPLFKQDEIFHFLEKRGGKIEALVITGGEPTLQGDLPNFMEKAKSLGLAIKLDTNGSNPLVLQNLVRLSLVDYVAMDLKTTWQDYDLVQSKVPIKNIQESADFLLNKEKPDGFHYEFRTTLYPPLVREDNFEEMVKIIANAEKYALQQYQPKATLAENSEKRVYPDSVIYGFAEVAEKYVKKVEVRGI